MVSRSRASSWLARVAGFALGVILAVLIFLHRPQPPVQFKFESALQEAPPQQPQQQRILCFVPVRNYTEPSILRQIQQTWGRACDLLLFTAHKSNTLEETVKLDYATDKDLWNMIHPAWAYVYERHAWDFDWFVKVDDDSYFSPGNMRHLGAARNATRDFYYLGHALHAFYTPKTDQTGQFNLGGAYALSQFALRQLGPHLPTVVAGGKHDTLPPPLGRGTTCRQTKTWGEDLMFSQCLRSAVGGGRLVFPNNSRDDFTRNHFMLMDPMHALKRRAPRTDEEEAALGWEFNGAPRNITSGVQCCASRPVNWHVGKKNREARRIVMHYLLDVIAVDPK